MNVADVNVMDEAAFVATFGGVFEHSPWVAQRAFAARPVAGVAALHAAMVAAVDAATADERLAAAAEAVRGKVGRWIYGEDDADLAVLVLEALRAHGMRIAVAESCTGGMLGMRLTAIPGSSDVVLGGVIAYANAVKVGQLGVQEETLRAHGAVSEETAREMALGAAAALGADVAVSITGVAGPGGGTPEKPVGTFCVAVAVRGSVSSLRTSSVGDRHEVRQRATQAALSLVRRSLPG